MTADPTADGADGDSEPAIFFEFPKTRLGNAVRKNLSKALSWLGQLTTERWNSCLKEQSLRGVLRAVAGLAQELETAESPALAAKNNECLQLINALLLLCSAQNFLMKSDETKHILRFKELVAALAAVVKTHLGETTMLDPELQVLQAALCA